MSDEKRQLSVEDILSAEDLEITELEVPEWGGVVHLRVMTAAEGIEVGLAMKALPADREADAGIILLSACMVNKDGTRMFQTAEEARVPLERRSSKVIARLHREAMRIQGWLDENTQKKASSETGPAVSPTG